MTMSARLRLVTAAYCVAGVSACGAEPGSMQNGEAQDSDCVAPLTFDSRSYNMLMGPGVTFVPPGQRVGRGRLAPCDDGGGESVSGTREVYAVPGVPTGQAVVVVGARQRGTIYLSTGSRPTAWDEDLLALLDRWSVEPPTP